MINWFKHAFAIGPKGIVEPTEKQREAVDRVCEEIARRHMTTPALLFLETFRPMNYLSAQIMHFFQPFVSAVLPGEGYRHFSEYLEQRSSIDYISQRIEEFEEKYSKQKKTKKKESKVGEQNN